ncbi:MAG: undecaprenyl-diphosphate phosphatase [Lachnospiraceae bacterium]|nr:undecaprenyl-diphosphate phosphatase [Lachnospiraceae bacterium]
MSFIEAIIMGLIQGLTEFLPVSSSGHLAIFKNIFHISTDTGLLYDVMLHIATLVAICVVYWKDVKELFINGCCMVGLWITNGVIWVSNLFRKKEDKKSYKSVLTTPYRRFVLMILISTVPTGILGVLLEKVIGSASELLILPGICLIFTAILLFIADHAKIGDKTEETASYKNSLVIGLAQGVATLPGLSRSGTTITACLLSGFSKEFAVKYSFIMSIPAILGAMVLEAKDFTLTDFAGGMIWNYIAGMIVAGVVGYICIKTMLVVVKKNKFTIFSVYCLIAGIISVVFYFLA